VQAYSSQHLPQRGLGEEPWHKALVHSEVWSPVLHDEACFRHVEGLEQEVNRAAEEELLDEGGLIHGFDKLRVFFVALSQESKLGVELVEQEDVHAADAVPLVEGLGPLPVEA